MSNRPNGLKALHPEPLEEFNYEKAFQRNLGWLTPEEQQKLRNSTVGIAGLGGVGGFFCESLARLGVGSFVIADFDEFEVHNFNRQLGASVSSLGRKKSQVLRDRILDINPEARVQVLTEGLNPSNLEAFVESIDLYIDGLDFFVLEMREQLIPLLQRKSKYAITAAPLGMGSSLMVFGPHSMGFEEYFQFSKARTPVEKSLLFLLGIAPSLMHRKALVFKQAVDLLNKKVPSTNMGCFLCAGIVSTTALKILLQRGPLLQAPWVQHFDAYLGVYKKSYIPFGNASWISRLKLWVIRRILGIAEKSN
jgi:molybdopterin/thiamine biosynthesis adenylyltransferase